MTTKELGRLKSVELREVWTTEAQDFTPWLAKEENLSVLANALNLELEAVAQETSVGPFRADILCRDTADNAWVLIENQLERTDHTHLGQLLTYAAGLQTVTIIWVAAAFSDEHRAALDWLNEITSERFKFFGLEIELWSIGNSPAAPKFNIVSRPNNWSRTAERAANGQVSTRALQQQRFWTNLSEHFKQTNSELRLNTPPPRNEVSFAIGRTNFQLLAMLRTNPKGLAVELRISGNDSVAHYELLSQDRQEVHYELDFEPEWILMENSQNGRIISMNHDVDPTDEETWSDQIKWMAKALEDFNRVFRARVRDINANDWQPEYVDLPF